MPFGIRRPLEYVRSGRTVIHPESYDSCPICQKPVNIDDKGRVQVAPCLFPPTDLPDKDLTVVLGCQSCYQMQKRLGFNSVEELILHKTTKTVKPAKEQPVKKQLGRPPKAQSLVRRSLSESDIELLTEAYNLIGRILNHEPDEQVQTDVVAVNMARSVSNQGLPDDDIEFGMTDEQRAAMDKAVHDASERTKLVPSESWNGKTAAEILAEEQDLPNGW